MRFWVKNGRLRDPSRFDKPAARARPNAQRDCVQEIRPEAKRTRVTFRRPTANEMGHLSNVKTRHMPDAPNRRVCYIVRTDRDVAPRSVL